MGCGESKDVITTAHDNPDNPELPNPIEFKIENIKSLSLIIDKEQDIKIETYDQNTLFVNNQTLKYKTIRQIDRGSIGCIS